MCDHRVINVDLQYFVSGCGVKENIIIKSKDVQNEFNILYKINNLKAKQKDDYTISLYNKENKEVYTIAAPFMTDKKGKSSTQLKLKITKQNGANLSVKLTADKGYLTDSSREFPVVIDPEITKKYYHNYYVDEVIGIAEQNHGPYYFNSNSYVMAKIYNLPQLEAGERIISAKYNFEITNASALFTSSEDDPIYFNAHRINRIDNNIVITYDADVLDYDTLTYDDNTYFSFDLTKTFRDWYTTNGVKGFVVEAFDSIGNRQVNLQGGSNAYSDDGSIGACLKLRALDASNDILAESNSIGITGTSEWKRLSVSISVPNNTNKVRVYLNLRYVSGTAWFDCLQMEKGNTANDYNAIDFSNAWTKNDNTTVTAQNGSITLEGSAGIYNNAEEQEEETTEATEAEIPTETVFATEVSPNDSVISYDSYGNEIQSAQGYVIRNVKKTYEIGTIAPTEAANEPTTAESGTEPAGGDSTSEDSLGNKYISQRSNYSERQKNCIPAQKKF